jgi:hypothetical protein
MERIFDDNDFKKIKYIYRNLDIYKKSSLRRRKKKGKKNWRGYEKLGNF